MYKCVEYFIYDLKCFSTNNSKLVLFIEEITLVDILKNNRFIVAAVLI